MRKFFQLSLGLIFLAGLTSILFAQETIKKPESITRPTKINKKQKENSMKYDVPLLGVSNLKPEKTKIGLAFTGDMKNIKAIGYVQPNESGITEIRVLFDGMKTAPKDKKFVLWLVSPEKEYTKLGHVMSMEETDEGKPEIYGKTNHKDFGLFVTVEEKDGKEPTSKIYSSFKLNEG